MADEYVKSGPANGGAPTWAQISALFNETDIEHMQAQGLDLTSCAQVSGAASTILDALHGRNGVPLMPPKSAGGPWPQSQIDTFQAWVDAGAQCPSSGSADVRGDVTFRGSTGAAPTWAQIAALFNQTDIQHMQAQGLDLTDCSQVAAAASTILYCLNGGPPLMPPAADGGPWPPENIALFQAWVDAGTPCS